MVMRDTGRIAWGRRVLEPVMKPSGKFTVITDLDCMADELVLTSSCQVTAHRFVSFDRPLHPWFPAALLTIEPLSPPVYEGDDKKKKLKPPQIVSDVSFWKGTALEWRQEQERLNKERAQRAKKKADDGTDKSSSEDKGSDGASKPKAPVSVRPVQRPVHAAGFVALPIEWEPEDYEVSMEDDEHELGEEDFSWVEDMHGEVMGIEPDLDEADAMDADLFDLVGPATKGQPSSSTSTKEGPQQEDHDESMYQVFGPTDTDDEELFGEDDAPTTSGGVFSLDSAAGSAIFASLPGGTKSSSSGSSSSSTGSAPSSSSGGSKAHVHTSLPEESWRGECIEDYSWQQPPGCSLKKYAPTTGSPYWLAILPRKDTDDLGRHTRFRAICRGRAEDQIIADMELWLLCHGQQS